MLDRDARAGRVAGRLLRGDVAAVAPFLFGISVAASLPFHRARHDVAPAAPVSEARRTLARLLAALPFVVVALAYAVLVAWRERDLGGLWIGMEPGRTTEALHTTAELAQLVALALVAVALGAALGRRMSRLVALVPALFVLWFVVSVYWFFGQAALTPFSMIQVQPVSTSRWARPPPTRCPSRPTGSSSATPTRARAGSGSGSPRRWRGGTTCGCSGSPPAARRRAAPGRGVGRCSPSGRCSRSQASSAQYVVIP